MAVLSPKTWTCRWISLLTAFVFFVTGVTGGVPSARAVSEISATRRFSVEFQKYIYTIPPEIGRVTGLERSFDSSPMGPFVIHIQDAHANPEAQNNISEILKFLGEKYPDLAIGVEGAAGPLHPEYLEFFQEFPETGHAVVEDLRQKGELTGAELYLYQELQRGRQTTDHRPQTGSVEESAEVSSLRSRVSGVEDIGLYRENLKTYRDLLFKRDEIQASLNPLRTSLESEASRILNPELRDFLNERSRRKEGKYNADRASGDPDLLAYVNYLRKQSLKILKIDLRDPIEQLRFPNLLRLVIAGEAQKGFDKVKACQEWRNVISLMKKSARDDADRQLISSLTAFGRVKGLLEQGPERFEVSMDVEAALFPRRLLERWFLFSKKHALAKEGYPAFFKSFELLILQAEIEATGLMREMEGLETRIIEELAKTDQEKGLVRRIQGFALFEKLLYLELTREEFRRSRDEISVLEAFSKISPALKDFFAKANHFYDDTLKRDRVLVENTLAGARWAGKDSPKIVVLITGGFHSEGIYEVLREKGIGFAALTPHISRTDRGEMYQKVMADVNADLKAYFKVKNPFLTKQEALLFKALVEVAAPALSEKSGVLSSQTGPLVRRAIAHHPVLSTAVETKVSRADESKLLFIPRTLTPQNTAISAPPATIDASVAREIADVGNRENSAVVATVNFGSGITSFVKEPTAVRDFISSSIPLPFEGRQDRREVELSAPIKRSEILKRPFGSKNPMDWSVLAAAAVGGVVNGAAGLVAHGGSQRSELRQRIEIPGEIINPRPVTGKILLLGAGVEAAGLSWDISVDPNDRSSLDQAWAMTADLVEELTAHYQGDIGGRGKDYSSQGLLSWILPPVEAKIFIYAFQNIFKEQNTKGALLNEGVTPHPAIQFLLAIQKRKESLARELKSAYDSDETIPEEEKEKNEARASAAVTEIIFLVQDIVRARYLFETGQESVEIDEGETSVNKLQAIARHLIEKQLKSFADQIKRADAALSFIEMRKNELEALKAQKEQKEELVRLLSGLIVMAPENQSGRHALFENIMAIKPDWVKGDSLNIDPRANGAYLRGHRSSEVIDSDSDGFLHELKLISGLRAGLEVEIRTLNRAIKSSENYLQEHAGAQDQKDLAESKQMAYDEYARKIGLLQNTAEPMHWARKSALRRWMDMLAFPAYFSRKSFSYRGFQSFDNVTDMAATGQTFIRECMQILSEEQSKDEESDRPSRSSSASYVLVVPAGANESDVSKQMDRYGRQIKAVVGIDATLQTHWLILLRGRTYVPTIFTVSSVLAGNLSELQGTFAMVMPGEGREGDLILNPSDQDLEAVKHKNEILQRLRKAREHTLPIPSPVPVVVNMEAASTNVPSRAAGLVRTDVISAKNEDRLLMLAQQIGEGRWDPKSWSRNIQAWSSKDASNAPKGPEEVTNAIDGILTDRTTDYERVLSRSVFAEGKEVPLRTLDLEADSKNKVALERLMKVIENHPGSGLRKDKDRSIQGFDFYENSSLGELELVLEMASMILAYRQAMREVSENKRCRLVPLFPLVSSYSQFRWIKDTIWPLAQQIAVWKIIRHSDPDLLSVADIEREVSQIGSETKFGIMVEYTSLLNGPDMELFLQDSDIVRLNVGNNDLQKDYWEKKGLPADREHKASAFLFEWLPQDLIESLGSLVKRAKANGKKVCFCGGMAETAKFLLAIEWWRRQSGVVFLDAQQSPLSVSVAGDAVANVNYVLQVFRSIPDEELASVFGPHEEEWQLNTMAESLADDYLITAQDVSALVEEWQERYERAGFHYAFYRPNLDPKNGIGGELEFVFLKRLVRAWLSHHDKVTLKKLRFSEEDSVSREELEKILDLLTERKMMPAIEKEKNRILEGYDFFQSVLATLRRLQREDPEKKFSGNLYPAILGEFIDAWESDFAAGAERFPDWRGWWLSPGRQRWDDADEVEKKEEQRIRDFYRAYHRHAENISRTVRRALHEIEGYFIKPVYTDERPVGGERPEVVMQTRTGLAMSRAEGLLGGKRRQINVGKNESESYRIFRENPALMFRVIKLAAKENIKISHRVQRALEMIQREGVSVRQLQPFFNSEFKEVLTLDEDIRYALWHMEEVGFLNQYLPGFDKLDQQSMELGGAFSVQRQTLTTLGLLESLYARGQNSSYERAASIFRELRRNPGDIKLVRLAILIRPIVEQEAKDSFSPETVLLIVKEFLDKLQLNDDPALLGNLVWILTRQHEFIPPRFLSNEDIAERARKVVVSPGANSRLFSILYTVAFATRAAEVDPASRSMLKRRGSGSPLANLERFYEMGSRMISALSVPSGETLIQNKVAEITEEVNKAITWGGKSELLGRLRSFTSKEERWKEVLKDYLEHTQGGEDPDVRQTLEKTAKEEALLREIFDKFSDRTSTYYMRTMDPGSLLKHLFLYRHQLYLREKKDYSTRLTAFFPLSKQYHQAYEVVIGSASETAGEEAIYARVLYENKFFAEDVSIRNPPRQPAVTRFLGYFPSETEMTVVQEIIKEQIGRIFEPVTLGDKLAHLAPTDADVYFDRADKVYEGPVHVDKKRVRTRGKTEVEFKEDAIYEKDTGTEREKQTVGVLVVRAASAEWEGQLLVLLTVLSRIHGLVLKDLHYEHLRGLPPETTIHVMRRDGNPLSHAKKKRVEHGVAHALDMKYLHLKKKEVVEDRMPEKQKVLSLDLTVNPLLRIDEAQAEKIAAVAARFPSVKAVFRVSNRPETEFDLKNKGALEAANIEGGTAVVLVMEGRWETDMQKMMRALLEGVTGIREGGKTPRPLFVPSQRSEVRTLAGGDVSGLTAEALARGYGLLGEETVPRGRYSKKIRKILIVDDEPIFTEVILGPFLESAGFEVKTAASGDEALEELKQFNPDAILSDVQMPGLAGPEWVEKAVKDHSIDGIPVIFMSANLEGNRKIYAPEIDGLSRGRPVHFLTKPFPALAELRRLFERPDTFFERWPVSGYEAQRSELRGSLPLGLVRSMLVFLFAKAGLGGLAASMMPVSLILWADQLPAAAASSKSSDVVSTQQSTEEAMREMSRAQYQMSLEPLQFKNWDDVNAGSVAAALEEINSILEQWKNAPRKDSSVTQLAAAHRLFFQNLAAKVHSAVEIPQGCGLDYVRAFAELIYRDLPQYFASKGLVFNVRDRVIERLPVVIEVSRIKTASQYFFPSFVMPKEYFHVIHSDARAHLGRLAKGAGNQAVVDEKLADVKVPLSLVKKASVRVTEGKYRFLSGEETEKIEPMPELGFSDGATAILREDIIRAALDHEIELISRWNPSKRDVTVLSKDYSLRQIVEGVPEGTGVDAQGRAGVSLVKWSITDRNSAAGFAFLKVLLRIMLDSKGLLDFTRRELSRYLENAVHESEHVKNSHEPVWRTVWQVMQARGDKKVAPDDVDKAMLLIEQNALLVSLKKVPEAYLMSLLEEIQGEGKALFPEKGIIKAKKNIRDAVLDEIKTHGDTYGIKIDTRLSLDEESQRIAQLYRILLKPERIQALTKAVESTLNLRPQAEDLAGKYFFLSPASEDYVVKIAEPPAPEPVRPAPAEGTEGEAPAPVPVLAAPGKEDAPRRSEVRREEPVEGEMIPPLELLTVPVGVKYQPFRISRSNFWENILGSLSIFDGRGDRVSSILILTSFLGGMTQVQSKIDRRLFLKVAGLAGLGAFFAASSRTKASPSPDAAFSEAMKEMDKIRYAASLEAPGYRAWKDQNRDAMALLGELNAFLDQWNQALRRRGVSLEELERIHRPFFLNLSKKIGSTVKFPEGFGLDYVRTVGQLVHRDLPRFFAAQGLVFSLSKSSVVKITVERQTTSGKRKEVSFQDYFFPSFGLPEAYYAVLQPDARAYLKLPGQVLGDERTPLVLVQPVRVEISKSKILFSPYREAWQEGQTNELGFADGTAGFLRADLITQILELDHENFRGKDLALLMKGYSLREVIEGVEVGTGRLSYPVEDRKTAAGYAALNLWARVMTDGKGGFVLARQQLARYLETAAHELKHVRDFHEPVWRVLWQIQSDRQVPQRDRDEAEVLTEQSARLESLRKTPAPYLVSLLGEAQSSGRLRTNYDRAQAEIFKAVLSELGKNPDRYGIKIDPQLKLGKDVQLIAQFYRIPQEPARVQALHAAVAKALNLEARAQRLAAQYSRLDPVSSARSEVRAIRLLENDRFMAGFISIALEQAGLEVSLLSPQTGEEEEMPRFYGKVDALLLDFRSLFDKGDGWIRQNFGESSRYLNVPIILMFEPENMASREFINLLRVLDDHRVFLFKKQNPLDVRGLVSILKGSDTDSVYKPFRSEVRSHKRPSSNQKEAFRPLEAMDPKKVYKIFIFGHKGHQQEKLGEDLIIYSFLIPLLLRKFPHAEIHTAIDHQNIFSSERYRHKVFPVTDSVYPPEGRQPGDFLDPLEPIEDLTNGATAIPADKGSIDDLMAKPPRPEKLVQWLRSQNYDLVLDFSVVSWLSNYFEELTSRNEKKLARKIRYFENMKSRNEKELTRILRYLKKSKSQNEKRLTQKLIHFKKSKFRKEKKLNRKLQHMKYRYKKIPTVFSGLSVFYGNTAGFVSSFESDISLVSSPKVMMLDASGKRKVGGMNKVGDRTRDNQPPVFWELQLRVYRALGLLPEKYDLQTLPNPAFTLSDQEKRRAADDLVMMLKEKGATEAEARTEVTEGSRKFVYVNIFAAGNFNLFKTEQWMELLSRIFTPDANGEKPLEDVYLIFSSGGYRDHDLDGMLQEIMSGAEAKISPEKRKFILKAPSGLKIGRVEAIMQATDFVITPDTGFSHLATALNVPQMEFLPSLGGMSRWQTYRRNSFIFESDFLSAMRINPEASYGYMLKCIQKTLGENVVPRRHEVLKIIEESRPETSQELTERSEVRGLRQPLKGLIKKILVVDDKKPIATTMRELLEDSGFEVKIAHSNSQALEILKNSFLPDVILTDVYLLGMNEMTGVRLVQEVEKLPGLARVPVVFMSASADYNPAFLAAKQELALNHSVHFLPKPFGAEALEELLLDPEKRFDHWLGRSELRARGEEGPEVKAPQENLPFGEKFTPFRVNGHHEVLEDYMKRQATLWALKAGNLNNRIPYPGIRASLEKFSKEFLAWSQNPRNSAALEKAKSNRTQLEGWTKMESVRVLGFNDEIVDLAEGLDFMIKASQMPRFYQKELPFPEFESQRSELRRTTAEARGNLESFKLLNLRISGFEGDVPDAVTATAETAVDDVYSVPGVASYLPERVQAILNNGQEIMLNQRDAARGFIAQQLATQVLEGGRVSGITNEKLFRILETLRAALPAGAVLPSGSALDGPRVHVNLEGLTNKDWTALASNFALVLGVLVNLRGNLVINVAEGTALKKVEDSLSELARSNGILLAKNQLQIVAVKARDPFALKGTKKADALVAQNRDSLVQVGYRKGIGSRWVTDDAGDMKTLAAAITTVLYATLDKQWETDRLDIHRPSEYNHGALLAAVLQAMQGYLQIRKAA